MTTAIPFCGSFRYLQCLAQSDKELTEPGELFLMHGGLLMQVESSEASELAKPSDISPLIPLEQSSVDISAADLAGKPAGSSQDVLAASGTSPYSASISEGVLKHSTWNKYSRASHDWVFPSAKALRTCIIGYIVAMLHRSLSLAGL